MKFNKNLTILHLDVSAGLVVGLLLFLLQDWVVSLYRLLNIIIIFLATANVCYGIYALTIALSNVKSAVFISILAIANTVWVFVCIAVVLYYAKTASYIGLLFICLEGIFVSFFAYYEWKYRYVLSKA
ncbi:hypothetical protein [Pseudoalteromonas sp. SG44-17]|uniref:hypothetical protein n=1 Tax=Pseudoalteromonas sp. SG44-17 TaxID=2760963 RepID=UPI0016026B62|nr:hypothetical protein [Pseudoalteromonas sp. SG44-17]MBB1407740.1 hypothetical protein [Pseudoalteromonas sp. SG44-17]